MKALPLFHRIAGQPVILLGEGEAAAAKRRLIERAGGRPVTNLQEGIDIGARLAFVAHDNPAAVEGDVIRLRCAGLLVNAVDRPELCDFTTPSIVDRDPVLVAVGTGGASAGLAKALRLRLERLLPQSLGLLASGMEQARAAMKARWPSPSDRRRALDAAFDEGGALDPLRDGASDRLEAWLQGGTRPETVRHEFTLRSDDPDDLTVREARLLGQADVIFHDGAVPPAILARARADAARLPLNGDGEGGDGSLPDAGIVVLIRRA